MIKVDLSKELKCVYKAKKTPEGDAEAQEIAYQMSIQRARGVT